MWHPMNERMHTDCQCLEGLYRELRAISVSSRRRLGISANAKTLLDQYLRERKVNCWDSIGII